MIYLHRDQLSISVKTEKGVVDLRGALYPLRYFSVTPSGLPACCRGSTRQWRQQRERACLQ